MTNQRDEKVADGQESLAAMNPDVFAAQYWQAYPRLHLVATGIIGDSTHAHDIVQEAAVIALERSHRYRAGASYVAWVSEIVRRCALNYARKVRGRRTTAADPELLATSKGVDPTRHAVLPISRETGELTDSQAAFDDETLQALNAIGTTARCCLLLRVIQDLSYAEISELMKIPEGTAMSHVHRSRRQLQRLLQQRAPQVEVPGSKP